MVRIESSLKGIILLNFLLFLFKPFDHHLFKNELINKLEI